MSDTARADGQHCALPVILAEGVPEGLEALAAAAAEIRDPWARHWLVIPGQGRPEWVQEAWARRCGIASRSQTLRVRALVELAAAGGDFRQRFNLEALTLALAACLPDYGQDAGEAGLPLTTPVAAGAALDSITLSWARQLADAIDTGLLCRVDPHSRFAQAPFLAALAADERVQPILAQHLGQMDEDAFRERTQSFLEHWQQREGVPYTWLYLDGGLPEVLWSRLSILLSCYPERRGAVLALSPSLQFWGDLRTGRKAGLAEDGLEPGPVLRSFGRRSQDLHQQLCEDLLASGSGGAELPVLAEADHLLGRLQASCRNLAAPEQPIPLARDDYSFSVHGCRSPLRELEVLRDRIRQALAADKSLQPEDILLLLVDPDVHASLVAAAFAADADNRQHLPFRINGGQYSAAGGVAEAFEALWQVLSGRCQPEDLRALLDQPLIREHFNLENVENNTLMQWLEDACFSWGVDAAQRVREQGPLGDRRHLQAALRRLALGAVVNPEQRQQVFDACLPLERASGLATAALADLARLWKALQSARQYWADEDQYGQIQQASGSEWCQRLRQLIDSFFAEGGPDTRQQRGRLLDELLPQLEAIFPDGLTLTAAAMRTLFSKQLSSFEQGLTSGGGGILIGPFSEYAGRPAKMVCICGLGHSRFPRNDERPAWHPLSSQRHWGDASRRDDDRHALLLALLAAERQLVCTYEAGSTNDATQHPPSTPLADLISAAQDCCCAEDLQRLHLIHPLNGFSPQAVDPQASELSHSQAISDALGAQALWRGRQGPQPQPGLWAEALPAPMNRGLRVSELRATMKLPCGCFLRRLGLHIPEEVKEKEGAESLNLDYLQQWAQRQRLIDDLLHGRSMDLVQQGLQASGLLGPGIYGLIDWQNIYNRLPDIQPPFTGWTALESNLSLALRDPDWLIEGTLRQRWFRLPGDRGLFGMSPHLLDRSSQARTKKGQAPAPQQRPAKLSINLEILLDMLLLAAGGEGGMAQAQFCGKEGGAILCWQLPSQKAAQAALSDWCQLVQTAMRLPIAISADLLNETLEWDDETGAWKMLDTAQQLLAEKWEDSGYNNPRPAPSQRPAACMAFRGLDDPTGWNGPVPEPDPPLNLPKKQGPLSLRWIEAIANWLNTHVKSGAMEQLAERKR